MTRTVANLVVEMMIANGLTQFYCLPGIQNDPLFDALYDRTDALRPIHTRHEQGAAYMAMGAALATGKRQVYCVVPGPGFLNSSGALCTAYAVNAPVLVLVGEIPVGAIGKDLGLLHEIPDQLGVLRGLTKQAERITGAENAHGVLQDAFAALGSGRPRPVGVEVPTNVWKNVVENVPNSLAVTPSGGPAVDTDRIAQANGLLAGAKRPMIVVGSGAHDFSQDITRLAEMTGAAVVAFRNGHGAVSSDNPLRIGMPVAHSLWPEVDVVIGLGSRLSTQQLQWGVDEDLKMIHIDIDETEIGRVNAPTVGIHADLADALPLLLAELEGQEPGNADWRVRIMEEDANFQKIYGDRLAPQLVWLEAIRAELPCDGIFVDELTQCGYVSRFTFPTFVPRGFISTGYQGTLGYGYATAIGVAHARRDVPVVSIGGDGGSLFTINELATAVHHDIPLTTVIFNDNAFGNVRLLQKTGYNERYIASKLTSPDFVKYAEAFGAQGLRATTPAELRSHLRTGMAHKGPTIIEVPVGELPGPWEFVLMPKVRGN